MIRFNKVSKTFRRNTVLNNVELSIAAGDRVALVGSNGAGKTTLIRCLLGEYTCDGKVLVDGKSPREHRREVLARFGFVPQLPPPLKMPVGQLLHFSAALCNADVKEMESVAKRLGLDPTKIRHQPFVKLSGGQKQKLLISIALGRNSDVLIMDEPAANLDPEARHVFFSLLAEKQEHAAMLISSHRLDEVAALVNRVVEMDMGRIVLDDHVADDIDINSRLLCRIALTRPESAFAKVMAEWGFSDCDHGTAWEGTVAGPDRLRYLGMISRYAGILKSMKIEEKHE
ncbi:Nitrous oxide reductase maturation protein NosF (ATPase) [hydrothermal vent metagenome]|uniref:Nitrous oxide reductase maturation protein NosF (ATPase) n=1 Tax=hydrothermal vent metagenome TaxID=652676 RepID=A0A3B1BJ51_9ZZZZ